MTPTNTLMHITLTFVADDGQRFELPGSVMVPDDWREHQPDGAITRVVSGPPRALRDGERWSAEGEDKP